MVTILDGLIYLAIFWLVLLYLSSRINFQRFNLLIAPLIIVWRTERFIGLIKKISGSRFQKFWRKIGDGSSIIYITLFAVLPIVLLINIFKALLGNPSAILGENPINFIDSSVLIIILPIFFALFVHEFAKLIMALAEDAEIEKVGLMVVVAIIAPFVQLANKSVKKLKRRPRIRILTIGMFANLILAMMFIPMLTNQDRIVSIFYDEPSGAMIIGLDTNSPASFSLQRGDVIIGIQRTQLNTIISSQEINSSAQFVSAMRVIPPGESFILVLQTFKLTLKGDLPPPDAQITLGSYIGIEVYDYRESKYDFLSPLTPFYFEEFIIWSISINLILGLFNVLPIPFSDGEKLLDELIDGFQIKKAERANLKRLAFSISILLLVMNIRYTFL